MIDMHAMLLPPEQRCLLPEEISDECPQIRNILGSSRDRNWVALTSPTALLDSMNHNGIELAVVMSWPWKSQERCQRANEFVAESIEGYPGRFLGLVVVNPQAGVDALRELEYWLDSQMFIGLKIKPEWQGYTLDDLSVLSPLLDCLQQRRKLLMVHISHAYQPPAGNHPHQLHRLLDAYPALTIIATHLGGLYGFYYLHEPFRPRFTNLYFDIAFLTFPRIVESYVSFLPEGHLLFGSDHPFIPQSEILSRLQITKLTQQQYDSITSEGAKELLRRCDAQVPLWR